MRPAAVLIAAVVLAGCASRPASPDPAGAITLQWSGCGYIAACPAYSISLRPDGAYRYEGVRNVPVVGVREGRLPPDTWQKAEQVFSGNGWQTLEDPASREGGYPCVADSPVATITRRVGAGEEKIFRFNQGCDSGAGRAILDALSALLPVPQS